MDYRCYECGEFDEGTRRILTQCMACDDTENRYLAQYHKTTEPCTEAFHFGCRRYLSNHKCVYRGKTIKVRACVVGSETSPLIGYPSLFLHRQFKLPCDTLRSSSHPGSSSTPACQTLSSSSKKHLRTLETSSRGYPRRRRSRQSWASSGTTPGTASMMSQTSLPED